jgi:hypothetical protein
LKFWGVVHTGILRSENQAKDRFIKKTPSQTVFFTPGDTVQDRRILEGQFFLSLPEDLPT